MPLGGSSSRAGGTSRPWRGLGVVVLLLGLATLAVLTVPARPNSLLLTGYGSSGAAASSLPPSDFTISGNATGLYPGHAVSLVLTVSNPMSASITVIAIATTVGDASPACRLVNLEVTPFIGWLVVPPRRSASIPVVAKMIHAAPNACEGARFPFRYLGIAVR